MARLLLPALLPALLLMAPGHAGAINVGDKAPDFVLTDAFGNTYTLTSFKKGVFEVWYEGKTSRSQNQWLKERIWELRKKGRLGNHRYDAIGIANYQETAIPNAVIDLMVRSQSNEHSVPVLCDRDGRMMRLWGFRNGRSNIYLFDAQRRLIWKSSGPLTRKRAEQYLRLLLRLTR